MKSRANPELREMIDLFPALDLDNYEATRQVMAEGAAIKSYS